MKRDHRYTTLRLRLESMFSLTHALRQFKICHSSPLLYLYPTHTLSSSPSFNHPKNLSLLLQGHVSPSHLLQIHAQIFIIGAHQDNLIATRLIGRHPTHLAVRVFNHLINPNIFPFNAIIRILADNGLVSHAFSFFKALKLRSLSPNDFTFSFLLKSCFRSLDSRIVHQIHTHIVKLGFNLNLSVSNGLLAVYAKGIRDLFSAHKVFDEMPEKEMICSWTCLIAGYAQFHRPQEALLLFLQMVGENLIPEDETMVSVLSACSILKPKEIEKWENIFSQCSVDVNELCRGSISTVLIYLYGKGGEMGKSREVFDEMVDSARGKTSVLPWNAIIGGYVQNGHPMEALGLFRLMIAGLNPKANHVTMVSVLSACAQVGDLDLGRQVHEYIKTEGRKGILQSNTYLATALIDMYSKCGSLGAARDVFDRMNTKDVVSFNAMIMGFALNGKGEEALGLFSKMEEFGVQPNDGTLLGVLCACTHSGLVDEGRKFFAKMSQCYSLTPKLEHYTCFIDLLARAGHVEEAFEVVETMPMEPNNLVWGALLGACVVHSRVDLAPSAAKRLVYVDPENSAGYVMLSNAYGFDRRWSEIAELRGLMREKRVRKQPGCSWISVDEVVHEFLVGSTSHPHIQRIHHVLDGLFKEMRLMGN
ncbi:putative pentatricopeptide repeat-containing protein At3g08820 [Tasmannia lanceolata]|uniref:putative pentatricopeptide repeat-containing protein At3g08820 n=1 Tax=Tasmannia lanceolata TaxID=3420 RepID=UPI004063AF09